MDLWKREPKAPSSLWEGLRLDGAFAGTLPGTTRFVDGSGLGNDGTLVGFALTGAASNWIFGSDINRHCLHFDGSDDVVNLSGPQVSTAKQHSYSVWVNLTAFNGTSYPTLIKMASETESCGISLSNDAGYLGILTGSASVWARLKSGTPSATFVAAWHHIVMTYNGFGAGTAGNFACYLDGSPLSLSGAGLFGASLNVSRLGWDDNAPSYTRLYGQLADPMVWSGRPLALPEIQWLANPANRLYVPDTRRIFWFPAASTANPWLYHRSTRQVIGGGTL